MNEFELIARLTQSLPTNASVQVGAGDDCAVLDLGDPKHLTLFKTDAIVEGIHFQTDAEPERIGHKALARCLSDIAAMGGSPLCALMTIALPRQYRVDLVDGIYRGMNALATRHHVAIAGGETTTNPERVLLSISMIGRVPRGKVVLRSGAQANDAIFVTGELGGSLAGRHLEFEPRLAEAQWLAAEFRPHSMIDISDGLAGDLRHILNASGVGAELLASAIPISRTAKLEARQHSSAKPALLAALTDGEDFELLFTISARQAVPLMDAWKQKFSKTRLSCIGKITSTPGLKLRDQRGVREFTGHGYVHFQKS